MIVIIEKVLMDHGKLDLNKLLVSTAEGHKHRTNAEACNRRAQPSLKEESCLQLCLLSALQHFSCPHDYTGGDTVRSGQAVWQWAGESQIYSMCSQTSFPALLSPRGPSDVNTTCEVQRLIDVKYSRYLYWSLSQNHQIRQLPRWIVSLWDSADRQTAEYGLFDVTALYSACFVTWPSQKKLFIWPLYSCLFTARLYSGF